MISAPSKIYIRKSSAELLRQPYDGAIMYHRGEVWVSSDKSRLSDELYFKLEDKLRAWSWTDGPNETRELLEEIFNEIRYDES